jgi:hypothetical protein
MDELIDKKDIVKVDDYNENEPREPQLKTILDNYKACCLDSIDTNTPLPSSPVFDNFLTEMNMSPEKVKELAYTKIPFFTEQEYIDTINDYKPHEDVFSYASYGKDLLFVLKRLYASYYKDVETDKYKDENWQIDWVDFKTQIAKDVHRTEAVIFDNDEDTLLQQNPGINGDPWTEQPVLNDYYIYICNQIFNRNIKPTPAFGLLDLINICVMTVAQTFKGTFFADFFMPRTGFGFTDGPYRQDVVLRYKFFCFLYGNKTNTINYDTQQNTIIYNMYQIVVNSLHIDDNGLGIRLVNIRMIADLNNNTAELRLIFYQSYCLYRHGFYIGDMFVDKDDENLLDADGRGIFYIYDYKTETGIYPTAKVSGTFSKGVLTAGTMVDIVLYSSQEEFDNDTFKNGVDKAHGVVGSLKSIKPGSIEIPTDINLNRVDTVYLSGLVAVYNEKLKKLADVTAIRKKTEDINRLVTTNKFVKSRPSLNKDSNKGMIVFQPDSEGRQYFYEGPIGLDKKPSNILYVSQQYGTIKQQLADNKTDVYISTGSPKRQNWYEFILKTQLSNYKEISALPLQWTSYSIEFGFDMLTQSSVPGFFTKELLETIGKTTNIDNALFSDKVRLLKVLEQVYIEAIIYMSAFILMLNKYKEVETDPQLSQFVDDALHNFAATESEASEVSDTKSNYEVFIDFNSKISEKYLVTELPEPASEPDTKDSSYNPAYDYSKAIIMPILSSLTPETSNLFKEINISTDTASNTNLIELLLILNKNIILILYMFTIITGNLGDVTCKTLLPRFDPLVVTPMFNLFKHIYEFIIKNAKPKPESISKDRKNMAIENSADYIIEHNSNEVMRLLLMMAMLFDKQTYSGNPSKGNKSGGANNTMGKSRRKNIVKRKWKTKNNINRNSNTKKYARVKIRKYTRK